MDLQVFLTTFSLVFLAEMGDKTQLTAMALATRFPWGKVFAGIAAAFALLNLGAVFVGRILFDLIPIFWIQIVSAILFLGFGLATLLGKGDGEGEDKSVETRGPFVTPFVMILFAELGDKTQLVTASLAAQHPDPFAVFAGSTLALWAVSLLGILLGRQIARFIPLAYIHKGAGVLFVLFGGMILRQALGAR